jgi:predicted dehydrogenase
MSNLTRREAIGLMGKASLLAGTTATLPAGARTSGASPNEEVRVAIIGLGVKGRQHIDNFASLPGVRVVGVVDVDPERRDQGVELAKKHHPDVTGDTDGRKVLDRKDVDAVVVATPNHWHGLWTVWSCQAGKDVYVEKPATHSLSEGRKMLEAERRYGRVVQVGTQNRTNPGFAQTVDYLRNRPLGNIQWIQGRFNKYRESIGITTGPQALPEGLDYNLFCGPSPLLPVRRKRFHYDWHWSWEIGNGDLGNNGAHITDMVREIMGDDAQPDRIMSYGGRFLFNDSGVTPNTHVAVYDYGGVPVSVEIRNLPMAPGLRAVDHLRGIRIGCVIQCEHGYVTAGYGGGVCYDGEGRKFKSFPGDGGAGHAANFVEAVRAGDRGLLNAPLEVGIHAAELFHLANLSWRVGSPHLMPETSSAGDLAGLASTGEALASLRRHLEKNGVQEEDAAMTFGPWINYSSTLSEVKSEHAPSQMMLEALLEPTYREPFVMPARV